VYASWTWPSDAAAIGFSSNRANAALGDLPHDFSNARAIVLYGCAGTSSCSPSSSSVYDRGRNVPITDRIWPSLMYTPRSRTKPLYMRRAFLRWTFFHRSGVPNRFGHSRANDSAHR
jgi:hypothetical protein